MCEVSCIYWRRDNFSNKSHDHRKVKIAFASAALEAKLVYENTNSRLLIVAWVGSWTGCNIAYRMACIMASIFKVAPCVHLRTVTRNIARAVLKYKFLTTHDTPVLFLSQHSKTHTYKEKDNQNANYTTNIK